MTFIYLPCSGILRRLFLPDSFVFVGQLYRAALSGSFIGQLYRAAVTPLAIEHAGGVLNGSTGWPAGFQGSMAVAFSSALIFPGDSPEGEPLIPGTSAPGNR
jgi:hypothetical protein